MNYKNVEQVATSKKIRDVTKSAATEQRSARMHGGHINDDVAACARVARRVEEDAWLQSNPSSGEEVLHVASLFRAAAADRQHSRLDAHRPLLPTESNVRRCCSPTDRFRSFSHEWTHHRRTRHGWFKYLFTLYLL